MKRGLWVWVWLFLLLWPASPVLAAGPIIADPGGRIFTDQDVTLEPGETFRGDLGLFRGNLTVPETSTIDGDLFVVDGRADIAGRIQGNVAVIGGSLDLAETGWVTGDVFTMSGDQEIAGQVRGNLSILFGDMHLLDTAVIRGDLLVTPGQLRREAGAQVLGELSQIPVPPLSALPREAPELTVPVPPPPPRQPQLEILGLRAGQLLGRTLSAAFLSLVFVALGVLVAFLWPQAARRVAGCIEVMPAQSFGLGLLTFLLAAGLEILAVVAMVVIILLGALLMGTVVLIPVGLLLILLSFLLLLPVPLALLGAMILGWVGLAQLIGQRVLRALKADQATTLSAIFLGLLLTVPIAAILWIVRPICCSWPFVILLTSAGLGAAFHTRFGTRGCTASPTPGDQGAWPLEAMDAETGQPDSPPPTP
jgi:cytoskeletal protein CcmA (bactofilin family)